MAATTIHNMFEFDGEYKTRLDFGKLAGEKVSLLMALEVLLLDEVIVEWDKLFCFCNSLFNPSSGQHGGQAMHEWHLRSHVDH